MARHTAFESCDALAGMPPAQTSTPSSFTQSATSEDSDDELRQVARVIFDFSPTSEFELGVSGAFYFHCRPTNVLTKYMVEGATVTIVEPDDGSGWVKVASAGGKNGLVPASYLELGGPLSTGPAPPPSHQGSGQFGEHQRECHGEEYERLLTSASYICI